MSEESDPSGIRSIAVTADDVVTAAERTLRSTDEVVLRVTPPYAGRMRARIHRVREGEYSVTDAESDDPVPVHVDPTELIAELPTYPEPEETEDDLRSASEREYTPERHREYHQQVVEDWREAVRDRIVDETTLEWDGGRKRVAVKRLG
ncbi:hypothetical protein [Natranaeroarchaeum sulfidigenes]|uniref:DUF8009 domain-containing protein n=1 Tax=Natranaeroarchaeum sulfidigenes TaxID=2784880 RepID=A0A897MMH9_9EURY|nr:hypothetical protein [Natranaeroarchaeum sulfidigenes]QSG01824.1 Uncharacterized protein AArcS_0597 [Natranaeroarchaeum sulfidigenes]